MLPRVPVRQAASAIRAVFESDPRGPAAPLRHLVGVSVPSAGPRTEQALESAGDGSRDLVFVRLRAGTGHVFNTRHVQGKIEFWDARQRMDGRLWFPQARQVYFYRAK